MPADLIREQSRVEGAATAGFVLAIVGAGAPIIEIRQRGFWGFVTSWEFLAEFPWLAAALGISWWALRRSDDVFKGLAGAGLAISATALAAMVVALVVLVLALLVPWSRGWLLDLISESRPSQKPRRTKRPRAKPRSSRRRRR